MIRTRSKKVLLVAHEAFPARLLAGYDNVKHISAAAAIFPAIQALIPDVIFLDYTHMGSDLERVLRRLRTNVFYKSVKVYLYKDQEHSKTDSLLKALGVDHIIYHTDLQKTSNSSASITAIYNVIDASLVKWLAGVAH
jgi:hypothetical protein